LKTGFSLPGTGISDQRYFDLILIRKNDSMTNRIEWPDGKNFAFTIFDDPDLQTADNVKTVYSFLSDLGFQTTKAVWPIQGNGSPKIGGATCEDSQYLKWVLSLKDRGFEIALHNVTYHTSTREETMHGLEVFYRLFGQYPYSMANHTGCNEGIYWGNARLSGLQKVIYDTLHLTRQNVHRGHVETSSLFWGDLCRQRIKYVRNFSYGDINTLKVCPFMPYHDPDRPHVNYWFAASEGATAESFNSMLSEENQDRLISEGGACIMYTHLACGFLENGKLNKRFKVLMERMSKMNGWFVPTRILLDHILSTRGHHSISRRERNRLERKWLMHKIVNTRGTS
jgi:hypothetical protein